MQKSVSVIDEESPLHDILDSGRLRKKFKDIKMIGQGGFGKVYKATYHIDQKLYAIKVDRIHISKQRSSDPMAEISKHRMYREIQAASSITSENIVRYFNSWFEELDSEDKISENKYREEFIRCVLNKKKNKSKKMPSLLKSVERSMGLRKSMFGKGSTNLRNDSRFIAKSIMTKGKNRAIKEESEVDDDNSKEGEMTKGKLAKIEETGPTSRDKSK